MPNTDANPILDEGAPTSTGRVNNYMSLFMAICIGLKLKPSRAINLHEWGEGCSDSKRIICSWTITMPEIDGRPAKYTFDLVRGRSPFIIGLDLKRNSDTFNLTTPHIIRFKRPMDRTELSFFTYISNDKGGERLNI